jgi:hypothetical protein
MLKQREEATSWGRVEKAYFLIDAAPEDVETVLVKEAGVALANFGLYRVVQWTVLERLAVQSVHSLVCESAVVSSEHQQSPVVHHTGMPPTLAWVVGLLRLQHPLQLLELSTLPAPLHPPFQNFIKSYHFFPPFMRSYRFREKLPPFRSNLISQQKSPFLIFVVPK